MPYSYRRFGNYASPFSWRPSISSCRCTYGYETVFRSIPHLLRHFPSSVVAWRHTSSNSVTRNYCCRAREVTHGRVNRSYLLTYLFTWQNAYMHSFSLPLLSWTTDDRFNWPLSLSLRVIYSQHAATGREKIQKAITITIFSMICAQQN